MEPTTHSAETEGDSIMNEGSDVENKAVNIRFEEEVEVTEIPGAHNSRLGSSIIKSTAKTSTKPADHAPEGVYSVNHREKFLRADSVRTLKRKWLTKQFARRLLAEFIGTGLIVMFGTGSVMSAVYTDALQGLFQIAAVWIIGVTLAIATTGPISGAHLNPSISIAFALVRPSQDFNWRHVLPYSIAQTAGAVFFSYTNLIMYSASLRQFEAANNIVRGTQESIASAKCFGEYYLDPIGNDIAVYAEAFGTAILAFVIFSLTHPKNDCQQNNVYIPPLIGCCVGALISVIAPLTQAGFNPARDFGPRLIAYAFGWDRVSFQGWWAFVIGPILGAPVGAAVAEFLLYGNDSCDDDGGDGNGDDNE